MTTGPLNKCPDCGTWARVRLDGLLGKHYYIRKRVQYECGSDAKRVNTGFRRPTVFVEFTGPEDWAVERLLREVEHALEHVVAGVSVEVRTVTA